MAMTWTPLDQGSAVPAATKDHNSLYSLTSPRDGFHQFDGSEPTGVVSALALATPNYFGYYIETQTNRGRRQYKFVPTNDPPSLKFGYRFEMGLGDFSRDGTLRDYQLDLQMIADAAEPGTVIEDIIVVFVRIIGEALVQVSTGATVPVPPVEPPTEPPPQEPPPEADLTSEQVVRFLNQTSFGASETTIEQVAQVGSYAAWIDQQFALPASLIEPHVLTVGSSGLLQRHTPWWQNVMNGEDQLRQRLAFAWSQIFVVSDRDYVLANNQFGMANFYDMLATQGDGNFRTLLERVTLHPVMGVYLSMLRNERADPARNVRPDENFAREVLQLFSIGLYELDPNGESNGQPTFDQQTVEEFAKVFTGWNYDGVRSWTDNNVPATSYQVPMVSDESFHDTAEKRLLNGAVVPPNQTAYADLTAALDNIFEHPNVGPFISRQLIQRLVTSNPTPPYVGRVAAVFNNNGDGVRGDMGAVVKALLLDDEARNGPTLLPATFGKVKEPIMRLTNLWRALDARPGPEGEGRYRSYARPGYRIEDVVGQAFMRAPSVFNFYLPNNPLEPGSELDSPEMQIMSEINVASTNNMLLQCVYGDNNRSVQYRQNITQIQIEPLVELAADVEALLDRLQLVLTAGQLPPAIRAALTQVIAGHGDDDEGRYRRVVDSLFCIVGSPFHLVQK